ncbi:hypothetical protein PGT21_020367 [Puccinia graminis f. sp. tritici]|uniref:Uncharacterized protein n=1 Tax=Puccinia graminis f. sp. tritici TaxID=56615 RepID=A0A5B0PUA5_PUCGR|nr:hypothetical protein PGT21_020367 [Puccinia graminis f. sp. tritici]
MSTNPNNNFQATAEQMKRNNANLERENTENPTAANPNPNPLTPIQPNPTQENPPALIQTPNPIPPKPKNPSTAKAPTGSTRHPGTSKLANPPKATAKHPLSLDKVATSAEKHCQPAKQAKDLTTILGAKIINVDKTHVERSIATNATIRCEEERDREAEKDKQTAIILENALEADTEGHKKRADMFYNIYTKLVTGKETPPTLQEQKDQHRQAEARIGKKNTVAGGTNFNWGDANSHDNVGFTPLFDKNILELKGPLPLTIFNKAWQDAALSYHAEKRPKTDDNSTEKGLRYTGLPYPSEWCMSYSDWSLNYAEFTTTMRDVYKYETLGEWIILHKENANKILRKDGFMVALRYDIRIRANAFVHRVVKNGVKSFLDISIFCQEVYDTAYAEARRYKELIFKKVNPYAIRGVRASWDPHTGTKKPT